MLRILDIVDLKILPDLVFGKFSTIIDFLYDATGPNFSLTKLIVSLIIVSSELMRDEISDRVDNYNYIVTDYSKGLPQFASLSVETALNKLSLAEV